MLTVFVSGTYQESSIERRCSLEGGKGVEPVVWMWMIVSGLAKDACLEDSLNGSSV